MSGELFERVPTRLPIFSPLDEVVIAEQKLYGLAYIDKGVAFKCGQNLLANLPYQGPGWYTKPALEYLLHQGIINWAHVIYGMDATGHLPKDILRQPLT